MQFSVTRTIPAPPDRLWRVLTDATRLADGSFGILRIDGQIARGAQIKLWSGADPRRAFRLRVSGFEPSRSMVWEGGMPLGLFHGRRTFLLEPIGGATRFTMTETFSGALSGLITRSMPDLQPWFETFADGLAAAAQSERETA